jgi:AcrR family transcriptional regulator
LSPGAIYSYFKSKEELLASLILLPLGYLFKRSQEVYEDDSLRVDEKMVAFLEVMYDTFKYDQLMLRNIFHLQIEDTLETLSPDLLQEIQYVIRKLISMWASVYQAGVDEGRFVAAPPIVQADIMWSTFSGLVMWEEAKRKLNPAKDYLKPTLDWAFQVMLNGIRKR